MQTFGRRVLDVPHIEIETAAIQEEPAIAGRFLVVAIVKINRSDLGFSKEIILNLRRPSLGIGVRVFLAEQTAVLSFYSDDPIHLDEHLSALCGGQAAIIKKLPADAGSVHEA